MWWSRWSRWSRKNSSGPALDGVELARGERVLAVARTPEDASVVATDAALHFPAGGARLRLRWELIDHATWEDGRLRIRETGGDEHRLRLAEPGSVPEAAQERITTTVVISSYARLPAGGGVRMVGRRAPGAEELNWTLVFDSGLDPADPGLRAQAEQLLTDLRVQTGL